MLGTLGTLGLALTVAVTAAPAPAEEIPGGYFQLGEVREPEPADGDTNRLVGSILFPLGFLRAGGAVAFLVTASTTDRCKANYGLGVSERTCSGLRTYGWVGIGYGGLMVVTGAAFLGLGLVQGSRHRAWKRRNNVAIAPTLHRGGGGVNFVLRF